MSAVPESRKQRRPVRLGFLGLGWIGAQRLQSLEGDPGVEIAALCDPVDDNVRYVLARHPEARRASNLDALLDIGLDGIVVATPTALHEQQALLALERGLPVFCQKPLATTGEGCDRVLASARAARRLLAVDYCYRHVAGMQELRARVLDGALGEILAVDLAFHNAYAPSARWCYDRAMAGGGCVLDLGIHMLDLALWLQDYPQLACQASRLYSRGRPIAPQDALVEDLAFAQFRQSNGACVRLACSWNLHAGQDARIELTVHGTRAGAAFRNVRGSFHDFEICMFERARCDVLAHDAGTWGTRALRCWVAALADGGSYDRKIEGIAAAMRAIDAVYGR